MKRWRALWAALDYSLRRAFARTIALGFAAAAMEAAAVVAIYIFMATLANGFTLPSGRAFDWIPADWIGTAGPPLMLGLGVATVLVILAKTAVVVAGVAGQSRTVQNIRAFLSTRLMAATLARPYADLADEQPGVARSLLTGEADRVAGGAVRAALVLVVEVLVLLTLVLVLSVKSVAVTAWSLLVFGALGVVVHLAIRRPGLRIGQRVDTANRARFDVVQAVLDGLKVIASSRTEGFFVERFGAANAALSATYRRAEVLQHAPRMALEGVALTALVLVVVVAADGEAASAEIIGTLGLFAAAAYRMLPSVTRVTSMLVELRLCAPALASVTSALARPAAGPPTGGIALDVAHTPGIEARGLRYRFAGEHADALAEIDFDVAPGEVLGIMGPNGAGKSTLIDLILGLRTPSAGAIRIDGTPLADVDPVAWRTVVGYVPQNIFIWPAGLAENVAFGVAADDIDRHRVATSLAMVALGHLAERFGLAVGDGTDLATAGLSGGERQRLAIARALYRQPRVLLLDEATSALDADAERQVNETVAGLAGDLSVIVVAHRLSALEGCDAVLALAAGRVVARGGLESVRAAVAAGAGRS